MSMRFLTAIALCAADLSAMPARAATADELQQIREQINQLKESYEARIQALEQRLQAVRPHRHRQHLMRLPPPVHPLLPPSIPRSR